MNRLRTLVLPATGLALSAISLWGCAEAVVGGTATGAAVVHDRRTVGTVIDDQLIEAKAIKQIFSDEQLFKQAHISVTSYNNIVLLTGESPTEELRTRAYNIAAGIPKVRRVHNEITIAAPSSALTRSSDTWITAKVKAKLFGIDDIEGFDPTRVKVVTENGTVYLMGLVTHEEADAATRVARTAKGVQRVVKIFEYVD